MAIAEPGAARLGWPYGGNTMKNRRTVEDWIGASFGIIMLGTLIITVFIVGSQIFWWLQHGIWPEYPLSKFFAEAGIGRPVAEGKGVQIIIDFLLSLHAGIFVFLTGLGLSFGLSWALFWILSLFERLTGPLPPN